MSCYRHRRAIRNIFILLMLLLAAVVVYRQQQLDSSNIFDALNFNDKVAPPVNTKIKSAGKVPNAGHEETVHDFDDHFTDDFEGQQNLDTLKGKAEDVQKVPAVDDSRKVEVPLDADHVSTLPSEFHVPKIEEVPQPVLPPLPELEPVHIFDAASKYTKLFKKLPTEIAEYCHLPYEKPRSRDAEHQGMYRLIGSYQLVTPGATAPLTSENGHINRINRQLLKSFDCTLDNAAESERIEHSFGPFRDFLKTRRNDPEIGEFVRTALRDDGACDPGQLTPYGVAYHFELGETLAKELVERERILNQPYEDSAAKKSESETETKDSHKKSAEEDDGGDSEWIHEVRQAARKSFRKRVRARTVRTQAAVIGALATMFSMTQRLHLSSSLVDVEVIGDRFCEPTSYLYEEAAKKSDSEKDYDEDRNVFNCDCEARALYAEQMDRDRDAQVLFPPLADESRQFNRYRDMLAKLAIPASQYDNAMRSLFASTCDALKPPCVMVTKDGKEDEKCFKLDELKKAVAVSEYIEWKWSQDRRTVTHAFLTAFPYFSGLVKQWITDIAGPKSNFKLLDTAARSAPKRSDKDQDVTPRDFVALQLDFADVNFLTHLRRAVNVSDLGYSTGWMGFGQRLSFELYESLRRAPGEVLVRIADTERPLTQKSGLMCPKTYGDGLCQLSRIHEYALWDMIFDTTGVYDFKEICEPLKPIHVEL